MRTFWLIILSALLLTACHIRESDSKNIPHNDTTVPEARAIPEHSGREEIRPKEYSDQEVAELTSLLDSIHRLDLRVYRYNLRKPMDSTFRSMKNLNKTLSNEDYKKLIQYCDSGKINLAFAKRILPFKIKKETIASPDEELIKKERSIYMGVYSFDSTQSYYNEFAIRLGYYPMNWSDEVYFFKGNKIVAYQEIYHRYGLDIKSFRDSDGNTVVYYRANFVSGSGLLHYNCFFYKYLNSELRPVLNIASEMHDATFSPIFYRELNEEVVKEAPLTIQYVSHIILADKAQYPNIDTSIFGHDTTNIVFDWNGDSKIFEARDTNNLLNKISPDYSPTDFRGYCLLQDYYPKFKAILNGPKGKARNNVLFTLLELKHRESHK